MHVEPADDTPVDPVPVERAPVERAPADGTPVSHHPDRPGVIPRERALAPASRRLPARRPAGALIAAIGARALPVVVSSIATGMAVLAAEQAVRSLVRSSAQRSLAERPPEPPAQPPARRGPHATVVYSEWTIIERVRFRR